MAPRLMGNISRNSEVKEMQLDKLKGTLVDFNELEHVLDNAAHVGGWQLEIRKRHDDPLEVDELVLHVQKLDNYDGEKLTRELQNRFVAQAEVHLNRITFHEAGEMRRLLGIGEQLKELKIVDNRPKAGHPSGLPVAVDKALESPNGHDHPALKEEVAT